VSGDGGLPDALPRPDHRDRRQAERLERGRVEAEVGADVWNAGRERATREPKSLARPEHRLVREIDDQVRAVELVDQRHAVFLATAQLLGSAREVGADHLVRQRCERVPHDRHVVLAVDDDDRLHRFAVISPSMRAVYFSNSSVSVANWMIFSWPWNGYLRQTATWRPENSITL
jgi:hypothetical protein